MALFVVGIFIALALNSLYYQQISYLESEGLQVSIFSSGFNDMIFLIATGALITIMGLSMLVLGSLSYFSRTVREGMARKDTSARIGNGLMTGGFIATALGSANLVKQFYRQSSVG
ncbi:MAG: hypothetical protein NWE93_05430 [Candidatus Bathyarchaeota archaeon]|nr:hypothetical protein [Candidatus Bathyarchaeota archaeon]